VKSCGGGGGVHGTIWEGLECLWVDFEYTGAADTKTGKGENEGAG